MLRRDHMTTHGVTAWLGLIGVLGILICQAYHPLWRPHLQVDVVTYQYRALSFLGEYSWGALRTNEYQPGALWFFALLGWLAANPRTFDAFLTATVLVNSLLIAGHVGLLAAFKHSRAVPLFLALALMTGPILLYRFELLVSLLVLGSWWALQRGWLTLAAASLGFAVAVKVYPLVLVPIYVAVAVQHEGWRRARGAVIVGLVAVLAPVVLFLALGGNLSGVLHSLEFHQRKPVGLEAVWADVVIAVQSGVGIPVRITPGFGVQGLTSDLPLLTNRTLNSIWLVPYGLVLWLIWRTRQHHQFRSPLLPFSALLVFVVFAKVLNPQYLWWFLSFVPLVVLTPGGRLWWAVAAGLGLSAVLSQLVYPLHYTEFVNWFRSGSGSSLWFAVIVTRNSLLVATTVVAIAALAGPRRARPALPADQGPVASSADH